MKRDMTVYVASVWFRDSDPHTGVVALTAKAAEAAIEEAIRNAAEMYAGNDDSACLYCDDGEDGDHEDCLMDAQAWSGVFPESLRDVLSNARDRWDIRNGLRTSGVAYLET